MTNAWKITQHAFSIEICDFTITCYLSLLLHRLFLDHDIFIYV